MPDGAAVGRGDHAGQVQARHLANLHDVEAERRAMYARPDCPPLPAAPEPDPGARRRGLLFHGLRQRLATRP